MTAGPAAVDRPSGAAAAPGGPRYGSDLIAELLRGLDIEYVALVPGATTRGLHDSLVHHLGNRAPQLILCAHENTAVNLARGYYLAKRKKMAVMLHDLVGLLNATAGIYDAWADQVPMLLIGGAGPRDAHRRRPWIDWVHTANSQGNTVRDIVKLDEEPASLPAVIEAITRASLVADEAPMGPTYVAIDVSLQESEVTEPLDHFIDLRRHRPPPAPRPAPGQIDAAAALLRAARRPVILTDRLGRRDPAAAQHLAALAERLGVPVVDKGAHGQSFPSPHPLGFVGDEVALVDEADVIVGVDVVDLSGDVTRPAGFRHVGPPRPLRRDQRVIQIADVAHRPGSLAPLHYGLPPADVVVLGDVAATLSALVVRASETLSPEDGAAITRRRQALRRRKAALDAKRAESSRRAVDGVITVHGLFAALAEAIDHDVMVLAGDHPATWYAADSFRIDRPDQNIAALGAGSIGCATGTVVGAALAYAGTSRVVVGVVGDGDFLMSVPALWTVEHFRLPLLLIVENNRSYFSDERHQREMASFRGRAPGNHGIGIHLRDPSVDLAGLARSFGVAAFGPVEGPAQLEQTFRAALAEVDRGRAALVDVRTGERR